MKYDSISGLFTAIADEIRAKDGSSELINPQDLPERVKNLSGIPNVPTLECWKIVLPSDEEQKMSCFNALGYFTGGGGYEIQSISMLFSEIDGNIYGAFGPTQIIGSGSQEVMANIFYVAFMTVGKQGYFPEGVDWFKQECLDICGEQISLSDFLSIAAQAQNYDDVIV